MPPVPLRVYRFTMFGTNTQDNSASTIGRCHTDLKTSCLKLSIFRQLRYYVTMRTKGLAALAPSEDLYNL